MVNDVQKVVGDNEDNIATNTANIATNASDISTNATNIATNTSDIATNAQESADIRTTQGTSNGDTDMGTFSGGLVTNNSALKPVIQEMIDAILGVQNALVFQGFWDASTNTPTLSSGVGTQGHFYIVSVAGSTNLDGITDWEIRDWAAFDGSAWGKVDNSEKVTSVFSRTGDVVAQVNDYTWAQIDKAVSSIGDIADVDLTGIVADQVLAWDGAKFIAANAGSGSGSGSGKTNYIKSPDASVFDDGDTAPDGTEVDTGITIEVEETATVSGEASYLIKKDAADRSGNRALWLNQDFNIAEVDRGKVFYATFKGKGITAYTDADFKVVCEDQVASDLTVFQESDLLNDSDEYLVKVLTDTTTTSIKFGFEVVTTSASAIDYMVNEIVVGPDAPLAGMAGKDWTPFTMDIEGSTSDPTKPTTTLIDKAFWRRVGDSMEISYSLSATDNTGALVGSGVYLFKVPDGYTIDSDKIAISTAQAQGVVGSGLVGDASNTAEGSVTVYDSTSLSMTVADDGNNAARVGSTHFFMIATNIYYSFKATVPIAEWVSGNLSSTTEQTLKSTVATAGNSSGQSIPNNSSTTITGWTAELNDFSVLNPTTGIITVRGKNRYTIKAAAEFASNVTNIRSLSIVKNGSTTLAFQDEPAGGSASGLPVRVEWTGELSASDTIEIKAFQNSGVALTLRADARVNRLTFKPEQDLTVFGVFGQGETLSAASSTLTPVAGGFQTMTGNSLPLPAGEWYVSGIMKHGASGGTPQYVQRDVYWSSSNASASPPTGLTSPAVGATLISRHAAISDDGLDVTAPPIVIVTTGETVYLNTSIVASTYSRCRLTSTIVAIKIK